MTPKEFKFNLKLLGLEYNATSSKGHLYIINNTHHFYFKEELNYISIYEYGCTLKTYFLKSGFDKIVELLNENN